MNNLLNLTKINLLTFFNFYKIKNSKNPSERNRAIIGFLCIIALFVYFGYLIFFLCNNMMKGLILINQPYVLLAQFMVFSSIYVLFTNSFKVNSILFSSKDFDLLMSMPIKQDTIIASKIILMYLSNIIYVFMLMIPAFLAYAINIKVTVITVFLFVLTLLIIPLVPLIISSFIGSILTSISSKSKHKSFVQIIISLAFIVVFYYLSYSMQSLSEIDMATISQNMVIVFNKIYPLTNCYLKVISSNNIFSLIEFIIIPIILFLIFIKIIKDRFIVINNRLKTQVTKSKYKLTKKGEKSQLGSLYVKELKRYFSSSNYVLNTSMGAFLLIVAVIALVVFGKGKIDEILKIENFSNLFIKIGPIIIGSFCAMNCSTASAISLEGKNKWIMKSIPVNPMKIFFSKIFVNLTILIPTIIIVSTALCIYLKANFLTGVFMFITPFMYAFFISTLGIILNLKYPNFDWKYEIKVIKQGMPTFFGMLTGFAVAIIPLIIKYNFSDIIYITLVTITMLVLNILEIIYLKVVGEKQFNRL